MDDINTPNPPAPGVGWDYCWTPNATNGTWTEYVWAFSPDTLPSGDYSTYQPLTDLIGCPLNGEWTITVTDLWTRDNGWIFSWSLNLDPSLYPIQETFTPALTDYSWLADPTIIVHSPDSIVAVPANAGTAGYVFEMQDTFGCVYEQAVQVPVLPAMHSDCLNCPTELEGLKDTSLCEGESYLVNTTAEALDIEGVTFEAFPYITIDEEIHTGGNALQSSLNINSLQPAMLTDAVTQISTVCIDIEHGNVGDLAIWLQAPGGQLLELSSGNGGAGTSYTQTCFSPVALLPITSASAPFTGDYQPEGNWSSLDGSPLNGEWQLLVSDELLNDHNGQLLHWSIDFVNEYQQTFSWTPSLNISCSNCPDPELTPLTNTQYILTVVDNYNCILMDTINVEVINTLAAPQPLCEVVGADAMNMYWSAINGASSYEISLDGGASWLPANGTNSHLLTGLIDGETIDFLVRAIVPGSPCPSAEGSTQCTFGGCQLSISLSDLEAPACWDSGGGSIVLSSSNAQGNLNYYLDNSGPLGPMINGIGSGNYSITAEDNWGCRDTIDFFMPAAPDSIQIAITIDSISCAGGQ